MDLDAIAFYERELARLNARADELEAKAAELERTLQQLAAVALRREKMRVWRLN
ncbi:MAG: hypothetical protein ACT443_06830 [Gemmatimonadota bacterium]